MNEHEIREFKENLMAEHWVEDRHHKLEELSQRDAKLVVESMDEDEVYSNVNFRHYQEDYIADYLEYVWKISTSSYWKHVVTSLDVKIGILWGDHMSHFAKMCNYKIPDIVMKAVLSFAIECDEKNIQDKEAIGCVIKSQVEKFNRLSEIENYISKLNEEKQRKASSRIKEMINCECKYQFG